MKPRLLACGLILGLLLTGCGGGETTPAPTETPAPTPTPAAAEFTLPYYATAALHPITGESKTNLTLSGLVYEGLFRLDGEFGVEKVLCKSYSVSDDGLTWTFTLDNRTFSNGEPLTAQDTAASLNLARQSARYESRLVDIKTVKAEEGRVIVILSRPHGELPALLDIPVVREAEGAAAPLGTGRYAFFGEGETLALRRNSWAADTLPETIPLQKIQGADDLVYAFDTREISLVTADLTGTDVLGYSGGYEVWDYPTAAMVYLGFRAEKGFCADPALRRAISQVIDRDAVVTALYSRHADASALPVPPKSALAVGQNAGSADVQAELGKAGYTRTDSGLMLGRKQVKLTLAVNTDNATRLALADYLATELAALGLDVTVNKLSWTDYTAALQAGDFDIYLAETILPADFDLTALVGRNGAMNYGRWAGEETEALLAAFRAAQAGEKGAAAAALYSHLSQQAPIAAICFKKQSALTQWGQVTGLTPVWGDPFAGDDWRIIG